MRLPALLLLAAAAAFSAHGEVSRFTTAPHSFTLDGQPFTVKAAELHYPRIPREYWKHRIEMCKALGMNTVCLYVFWNYHEPRPGEFDFTGERDLRAFIKLCGEAGMKVILRPGPYVCAEWEMGGLPWWLLKDKEIRLRENDPKFLERVRLFEEAVAEQVADLTIDNGGPIIMVQVENEYGSYGTDKPYVTAIRDMLRKHYGKTTLFQCDWSSNFLNNGLDDLVWSLNFGTGADVDAQFAPLREVRPQSPLICSEYWSGWFDKWGANHETRPASEMIKGIDEMLSKGISFSLYMTHGGTNWGHWAGANSPGYAPDVTSYDYDAPINEQGAPTPKYNELRNMLAKYNEGELPPIPDTIPVGTIPEFRLTEYAPLAANIPSSFTDTLPRNMEAYDQGFGSIYYSTTLPPASSPSSLEVKEAHDYAQVWVNGLFVGKLDRRLGETTLPLPAMPEGGRLDILVEAMGRINFGRAITDRKGIDGEVTIISAEGDNITPGQWDISLLPDEYSFYKSMNYEPVANATALNGRLPRGVYKGTFTIENPTDTYLDFSRWGKGLVYINGFGLGRIWEIGPQLTLYTPAPILKKGENEILIFDIAGPEEALVQGLNSPIIDKVRTASGTHAGRWPSISFDDKRLTAEGRFPASPGWQEVKFAAPVKGRYLCLQARSSLSGEEQIAVAELQLLDSEGNRISREPWRVTYADSELTEGVNCTGEKTFDLQESTYWQTAPGSPLPHCLVIDLGKEQEVSALQYLPRAEASMPGAIAAYRIYIFN